MMRQGAGRLWPEAAHSIGNSIWGSSPGSLAERSRRSARKITALRQIRLLHSRQLCAMADFDVLGQFPVRAPHGWAGSFY